MEMKTYDNERSHRYAKWMMVSVGLLCMTGCAENWEYCSLRGVQTELPRLMDSQYSRRRDYTPAEMLTVQSGGGQTLLIARSSRAGVSSDVVAQLDEEVDRTFVVVLDGEPQAGKTYHVTPETGRVIEGTTFRPSWRPYRGLEGDVTIMSVSAEKIVAAVRLSALMLKPSDPERSLRGVHPFRTLGGNEPLLRQAQINFEGGVSPASAPAQ
jgi:hypothetical protein